MSEARGYTDTERRIEDALVGLAMTRDVDKITVKDIAEAAHISRRTFYSHYRDMPDVMESILRKVSRDIIQRSVRAEKPEEIIEIFFREANRNFPVLGRALDSRFRAGVEQQLLAALKEIFTAVLKSRHRDRAFSFDEVEFIVDAMACLSLGYLLEHYGKRDLDSEELSRRVMRINEAITQRLRTNSEKAPL